ncbi:MAG: hypothetical protein ACOX9E_09515 [Lentisphaeria bacterium]|jgi:hypothetical protein
MILFKCTCGLPGMAPDGSGGRECSCGGCGATLTVPAASDPDCVLVYRSGLPVEGQVLTIEQFQGMVEAGELRTNDLIWYQDIWIPLGEVFEMPEAGAALPVSGADLAINLAELPPIPLDGVMPAPLPKPKSKPKKARRIRPRKKIKFRVFRRFDQGKASKRTVLVQVAYYAVVIVVLILGYKLGLGKILNYALHRPSYVLVCNGSADGYDLRLMGQNKAIVAGGNMVFQDLYVSGTCRRTLEVAKMDSREVMKRMKVPIKPGMDVVVNLDSKQEFAVYDLAAAGKRRLPDRDIAGLADEISAGKEPSSIFTLCSKIRGMAAPLLLERKREEVITSHQYDLSKMPILRSPDYLSRSADKAQKAAAKEKKAAEAGKEVAKKAEVARPKRFLLPKVQQELKFQNVTILYDPDTPQNNFTLNLDFKKGFQPMNVTTHAETRDETVEKKVGRKITKTTVKTTVKTKVHAIKGRTTAKVTFTKDKQELSFSLPGKVEEEGKRSFNGNWSYHASMALTGKDKDNWRWEWKFTGRAPVEKGKKSAPTIVMTVDQAGKISIKTQ